MYSSHFICLVAVTSITKVELTQNGIPENLVVRKKMPKFVTGINFHK